MIGEWRELMTLFYLRHIEGEQPDLDDQPFVYPTLLPRLERWQGRYDPDRRPFVIVSVLEGMRPHLAGLDSISVGADRWIYVHRRRLVGLSGSGIRP